MSFLNVNKNIGIELTKFSKLFIIFAVLNLIDSITTLIFTRMGYTEIFDWTKYFMFLFGDIGAFWIKLIVTCFLFFIFFGIYIIFDKFTKFAVLAPMCVGVLFVICSNVVLIFSGFSPFEYILNVIGGLL